MSTDGSDDDDEDADGDIDAWVGAKSTRDWWQNPDESASESCIAGFAFELSCAASGDVSALSDGFGTEFWFDLVAAAASIPATAAPNAVVVAATRSRCVCSAARCCETAAADGKRESASALIPEPLAVPLPLPEPPKEG